MTAILERTTGKKQRSLIWLFLFLILLTCLVRMLTWFPPVIDHDESTYLIIANQILKGDLPYTRLIDIKPVGIYFLFAALLKVFGHHIILVRLAGTLTIAGTAFMLLRAKTRIGADSRTSLLVAMLYIALASLHKWSWTSNTELFFNFFIACGLYFFLGIKSFRNLFLSGLMLGIAFIFKYVVALDFACFGLVFLLLSFGNLQWRSFFLKMPVALFGFALPFAVVHLLYYLSGHYAEFLYVTFDIPSRYSSQFSVLKSINYILEFYGSFFMLLPFYFYSLYLIQKNKVGIGVEERLLSVIWPVAGWMAILSTGKMFFHYYFQALIPFAFFIPDGISRIKTNTRAVGILFFMLCGLLIAGPVVQYFTLYQKQDNTQFAADYLNEHLTEQDQILVENQIILYFMTNKTPIIPFVHPSLIIKPEHIQAYGIDPKEEMDKVYQNPPSYWVVDANTPSPNMSFLQTLYTLDKTYGNLNIYRKNVQQTIIIK